MSVKIEFQKEHLPIIEQALEVFSRFKMGQIGIALDELFPEKLLTYEERIILEKIIRATVFPSPPELRYDGHGGYKDQYGNFYNEQKELIEENVDYAARALVKRAIKNTLPKGSYYGIGQEEIPDAGIAYEIRQTIRQYLAVTKNDGFFEPTYRSYDDPLPVSDIKLPIIEGFDTTKDFHITDLEILESYITDDMEEFWCKVCVYFDEMGITSDHMIVVRFLPHVSITIQLKKPQRKTKTLNK
jgi:hypothetical protein